MTCDQIKSSLFQAFGELECTQFPNGRTVVSSFFMNLDGDFPEVNIFEAGNGNLILTDFGETFRGLADNNIDALESAGRSEILERISSLLDVTHKRGAFQIEVAPDELGEGLYRMFQALAFAEDMVFTANPREEAEFRSRVSDFLEPIALELNGRLSRNQELKGKSGRAPYKADFHLHVVRDVWIEVITATTKSSFQNQVNHAHAMWSDVLSSVRSITLLDDTNPFMDTGSARFLSTVSNVVFWSDQVAFRDRVETLTGPGF